MQINSDNIDYLVGDSEILTNIPDISSLPMFSDNVIEFLNALSRKLQKDRRSKGLTDVLSYAFWIRKASVIRARDKHLGYENRIGRGVAFHIAPSNVPVNFAVSMTSSILAGNASIIRVSNSKFLQVDVICDAIRELLENEYIELKPYFCIIRYEHSEKITTEISSICDLRIIWGGNQTIEKIRRSPLPPRSIEMTFADRHSIAVIETSEYLKKDASEIARGFYIDTYYTDQNACSSPRLIVWIGSKVEEARSIFWKELGKLVHNDYDMKPIQAIDKYSSLCKLGMADKGYHLVSDDNFIVRVEVDSLTNELMNFKDGGGFFFEYIAKDLSEIVPVLTKQCQTVSVLGISKSDIKRIVFNNGVRGVDRIVDLGQTMGLEFVWDGYKMIESMSRVVYVGD